MASKGISSSALSECLLFLGVAESGDYAIDLQKLEDLTSQITYTRKAPSDVSSSEPEGQSPVKRRVLSKRKESKSPKHSSKKLHSSNSYVSTLSPIDIDAMIKKLNHTADSAQDTVFVWNEADLAPLCRLDLCALNTQQVVDLSIAINKGMYPVPVSKILTKRLGQIELLATPKCDELVFRDGTADDVLSAITGLSSRVEDWTPQQVSQLVLAFRGLGTISHDESSPKALEAYNEFAPRWYSYIDSHPAVAAQLDPYVVIVDFAGAAPPAAWPPGAAYPGAGSSAVLAPVMNGRNYARLFVTEADANTWAGYLRGTVGLHSWIVRTTAAVRYI